MKNGAILVIKERSQYDLLGVAADEISRELTKTGYKVIVLDLIDNDSIIKLLDYLNKETIEFIYSFNAIALNLQDVRGNYIFNYYNIPMVTYLVDHPMYHYNRLSSNYKNLHIATFDRENVQFLKTYYKSLKGTEFIPFLGFKGTQMKSYVDRDIDILFVGTYDNPDNVKKEISCLTGIFKVVAEQVIKILLKNTSLSLEKAMKIYFENINFEISDEEFLELISIMTPVDKYIHVYFRDKVVRTVLDAGMKLAVYGDGWNNLKDDYQDNLIILNGTNADLKTGLDYMADAKIVLSVMPWSKGSIQANVTSTMLSGAISVTNPSIYINENLSDGKEIVFYSLDNIELLPSKISYLLEDEKIAVEIAKAGMSKAKSIYSVQNFVQNIIKIAPKNYRLHVKENLINKYETSDQDEIKEVIDFIKKYNVGVYNYDYIFKYANIAIDITYDNDIDMYYVMHFGKRMYYPKKYRNSEDVAKHYRFIALEQDVRSPHRYLDQTIFVEEGDVVIDAGVAEGNFSLEVVDKVSKLYLIECEDEWMEALKQSFKPYKHKVVFVKKFLSNKDDDYNITIDNMVSEKVNFIKMDIEGAELDALEGAKRTLMASDKLSCAICSYHRHGDEDKIKEILSSYKLETSTSNGYMFFLHDEQALMNSELRRGLVRGIKRI